MLIVLSFLDKISVDTINKFYFRFVPELDINFYGLQDDLNKMVKTEGIFYGTGTKELSVKDLIQKLQETYSGTIGAEFQHLQVQTIFFKNSNYDLVESLILPCQNDIHH